MNDDTAVVFVFLFVIVMVVLGVATLVTSDTTYYNAEVVSKHFDYSNGKYYVDFYSTNRTASNITLQVSSETYQSVSVGECKLIQEAGSFWGHLPLGTTIYGDCP